MDETKKTDVDVESTTPLDENGNPVKPVKPVSEPAPEMPVEEEEPAA